MNDTPDRNGSRDPGDETPDNVIPPSDFNRRRMVMSHTEDIADFVRDITERVRELHEIGVPPNEWLDVLIGYAPDFVKGLYASYGSYLHGFLLPILNGQTGKQLGAGIFEMIRSTFAAKIAATPETVDVRPLTEEERWDHIKNAMTPETLRMKKVIDRLFDDAPQLTDASGKPIEGQNKALECSLILKAGGSIMGSLARTAEGTLKLLAMNQIDRKPIMVEHHFDYDQVADLAVFREVTADDGPRIHTS